MPNCLTMSISSFFASIFSVSAAKNVINLGKLKMSLDVRVSSGLHVFTEVSAMGVHTFSFRHFRLQVSQLLILFQREILHCLMFSSNKKLVQELLHQKLLLCRVTTSQLNSYIYYQKKREHCTKKNPEKWQIKLERNQNKKELKYCK